MQEVKRMRYGLFMPRPSRGVVILSMVVIFSALCSTASATDSCDGNYWMQLTHNERVAWLDGYLAAFATTVVTLNSMDMDKAAVESIMDEFDVLAIASRERDMDRIASLISDVYASRAYWSIELPMALSIVRSRVTKPNGAWRLEREFWSLPIEVQEKFEKAYYGAIMSETAGDEVMKQMREYMIKERSSSSH